MAVARPFCTCWRRQGSDGTQKGKGEVGNLGGKEEKQMWGGCRKWVDMAREVPPPDW